jgi:branched-chain amino acid transport system substrate-binding protein
MMRNSYEMALEEINQNGGINGRPLELVYADDEGKRLKGEECVINLKKKHKSVMLIGGYSSTNTLYMAWKVEKLDIPFLVCTAADDRITQRNHKNIYRLNPPASEYNRGLESFFTEKVKPESMSILYENSPYGTSAAIRMMWFCREADIDIHKIIPYYKEKAGTDYLAKLIAPLETLTSDIIYMVSYFEDGATLVKLLRNRGIKSLLCGGAGGFTHPDFYQSVGEPANNLVTATLWHHKAGNQGAATYYDNYLKQYSKTPDYHGAEAYSALLVAADALKRATVYTPQGIRDALGKTNLETPLGKVAFYAYGDSQRQNSFPTLVMQIQNGEFQCIWPEASATSKFVPQASK